MNGTATGISERLKTDQPWEGFKAALAHVVRNRVEAAYARSDLFGYRCVLMGEWANYLDRVRVGEEPDANSTA